MKKIFSRKILAIISRIRILINFLISIIIPNLNSNKLSLYTGKKIYGKKKISKRIFNSYKLMKLNQRKSIYSPSPMWEKMLNKNYKQLIESYREDDFDKFDKFLNNFGSSPKYLGITFNILIPKIFGPLRRIYEKKIVFENQFKNWIFFNKFTPVKSLNTKRFGNIKGGTIDKKIFVSYTSFFNQIYASFVKEILKNEKNPSIVEIGPGYGEQAYFILKDFKKSNYLCLDIPEVLALSSFYLMNSFPKKKFLLYGEKPFPKNLKKYDILFFPQEFISSIKANSTDIVINKYSLGEMNKKTVKKYILNIEKIANYFFHINQDYHYRELSKRKKNILASEYRLNKNKFSLLVRYLDISHFIFDKFSNYNMDLFFHIYKKIKFKKNNV